jgi:hypothetical protein
MIISTQKKSMFHWHILPCFHPSMKIHPMFHVSLLEPYHMSTILGRIHDPPSPIKTNGEQKYDVQYILDSRVFN